jgi:hypothetical protein
MIVAAFLAFGALLAAWVTAPAERRRPAEVAPEPMVELAAEAQAA